LLEFEPITEEAREERSGLSGESREDDVKGVLIAGAAREFWAAKSLGVSLGYIEA